VLLTLPTQFDPAVVSALQASSTREGSDIFRVLDPIDPLRDTTGVRKPVGGSRDRLPAAAPTPALRAPRPASPTNAMPRTPHKKPLAHGRTLRGSWLLLALAAVLWGCGGGGATPASTTISKDKFVTTYVKLREAAATVDSAGLDSARAAILRQAGVTQKDMLAFADVHGRDVAFMKDVWDEVEHRLEEDTENRPKVH
jgi:hypothetical protein